METNKPVAWMIEKNGKQFFTEQSPINGFHGYDKIIPLYTHPVINPYQSITNTKIEPTVVSYTHPVKELTDEKIKAIAESYDWEDGNSNWAVEILFAKECIKKAQE